MTNSTEEAFLAQIASNPEDRLARLVYADWLEEQDDELSHRKAKLLRMQEESLEKLEHAKTTKKYPELPVDQLRQLTDYLPHDWCPRVLHPKMPRYILSDPKRSPGTRRIIKTARSKDEINAAARQGYWPVVAAVQQNPQISSWVAVYQDPETGQIETTGDHRYHPSGVRVVNVRYYPHQFLCPYAAYLVPEDLPVGEEVWLEDVIEDIVGIWGNQGHTYRLQSAPARWDGTRFEILFDPARDAPRWIG